MEVMEILIGFDAPNFEKKLAGIIAERGFNVSIIQKHSRPQIREYITMHQNCQTVILKEKDNALTFTAEEFALLNDDREDDLNVICILSESRRNTNYMSVLYAAGITSAIFPSEGNKITPEQVAELCIKKRSRKEARKYYGIANVGVDIGMLSPEAYTVYYQALLNRENGKTLILRYLNVIGKMTPAQNEDFLSHLPKEIVDELREYKEYYDFLDFLKAQGIKINEHRPKNLKLGRTDPGVLLLENKDAPATLSKPRIKKGQKSSAEDFDFGSDAFESLLNEIEEIEGGGEEESSISPDKDDSFDSFVEEMEEIYSGQPITEPPPEKKESKKKKPPLYIILAAVAVLALLVVAGVVVFFGVKKRNVKQDAPSEIVSEIASEGEDLHPQKSVEPLVPIEEYIADYLGTEKTMTGEEVIRCINCYPKEQFKTIFESDNRQIIFIDGGASNVDIPEKDLFLLTQGEGEYIFTKKE